MKFRLPTKSERRSRYISSQQYNSHTNTLEQLHIRIKIRKLEDEEEYLYGITTYYYYCIYINWFLTDPNIQNYPKNLKFYTYEQMI